LLLATDAAEALVREGVPFRDAHEQVAEAVRAGSFEAPRQVTDSYLLGRGIDVAAAVTDARVRWS
jgi:argininosuccinate lyase